MLSHARSFEELLLAYFGLAACLLVPISLFAAAFDVPWWIGPARSLMEFLVFGIGYPLLAASAVGVLLWVCNPVRGPPSRRPLDSKH